MDRIDALGDQYHGSPVLSKDLLAETEDAELQTIVETAAKELDSPIALVSLILDQIQFFKAHIGLPDVLASARGTHRDASFCQFVVRDGATFEVNDAINDTRIPQHVVKEYNIQAYLGIPIKVSDTVVGSLCVLDTKKRTFSASERKQLIELAERVNKRLEEITRKRKQARLGLAQTTLHPAVTELYSALSPIQEHLQTGHAQIASVRSFLDLHKHLFSKDSAYSDTVSMSFEAAQQSIQKIQEHFSEIEMSILDGVDCLEAINNLYSDATRSRLSKIIISAQDLSRHATKSVGGFPLPDFLSNPLVRTKTDFAVALVSNCLLLIASELKEVTSTAGITLHLNERSEAVELTFRADGLKAGRFEAIAGQLNLLVGKEHPTVALDSSDRGIQLTFKTLE